jgi:DNA polymerase-3 subunit epsilon
MSKVVALDFETANYPRDSAIALGVSVIENGVIQETRSWLFRPPGRSVYIREDFIRIHGIRPADLKDKPHFHGVWQEIEVYLKNADLLIAHNAGFDRSVLSAVAAHYSIALPQVNWQCTVNIARRTWPHLVNHKLPTVCTHLGIELKHHDPASDAEACSKIFLLSESAVGRVRADDTIILPARTPELDTVMAQYRLGMRYYNGQDVAQNYTKALNLLRRAAEQGYVKAQSHLAHMYHNGEGVPQDTAEAAKWYARAKGKPEKGDNDVAEIVRQASS